MPPRARKGGLCLVVAVAMGIVVAALALYASRAWSSAQLPALPTTIDRSSAIYAHLAGVDAVARVNPRSAAALGALGVAYHADLFYAEAVVCYINAERL